MLDPTGNQVRRNTQGPRSVHSRGVLLRAKELLQQRMAHRVRTQRRCYRARKRIDR
jgi:hypothetical protein